VRFGDPEAQVVLPLLDSLSDLLTQFSKPQNPKTSEPLKAVGVVLAARGYPGEVRTGDAIHGLNDVARDCPDVQIFYAGVRRNVSDLVTSGGRVLTVMATAPSYEIAIARAYEAASKIRFNGMQYRRDIGKKALVVGS